jgi:hypothetical protein
MTSCVPSGIGVALGLELWTIIISIEYLVKVGTAGDIWTALYLFRIMSISPIIFQSDRS